MTTKYMEKFVLIIASSLATMVVTLPFSLFFISISKETTNIIYCIIIVEVILISCIIAIILLWLKTKYKKSHSQIQEIPDSYEFINQYNNVRRLKFRK